MKQILVLVLITLLFTAGCHFHLDLLGKKKIEEVTLVKSGAREKILMIDLDGLIASTDNPGLLEKNDGNIISRVYLRLQKATEDPYVRAVILRVDTPGGEVTASDIIHNEILRFKAETQIPVVALMMGLATSGGYYIASASDHIIAHPSTITGSIGVISVFPNIEGLFGKIGVDMNVITSGNMKDSGSPFREMEEEEKEVFQNIVDTFYRKFLQVVYEGRQERISMKKLQEIADGRVYTAPQALELQLIDEIGYINTAIDKAKALAKLPAAKIVGYTYFPNSKTNLYATQLQELPTLGNEDLQEMLQTLQSGFYYLWLPQLGR
jgi:protease-4